MLDEYAPDPNKCHAIIGLVGKLSQCSRGQKEHIIEGDILTTLFCITHAKQWYHDELNPDEKKPKMKNGHYKSADMPAAMPNSRADFQAIDANAPVEERLTLMINALKTKKKKTSATSGKSVSLQYVSVNGGNYLYDHTTREVYRTTDQVKIGLLTKDKTICLVGKV
jgi:hypothetical protein